MTNKTTILNVMPGAKNVEGVQFYPTKPAFDATGDEKEDRKLYNKNSKRVELAWERNRKEVIEAGRMVVEFRDRLYRCQKFPGATVTEDYFEKRKPFAQVQEVDGTRTIVKL